MKTAFASLAVVLLFFQTVGRAAPSTPPPPADALKFFKNYFVTGDYAIGGVGVRGTGVNGIAKATIDMTNADMPDGVDVLAAFLYWETVDTQNGSVGSNGASFNGHDISTLAVPLNPAGTAPCWSSGGGTGSSNGAHKMVVYRADVLRFLDQDPLTGKLLVKTAHTLTMPDAGRGNVVPSTAGATLVVVYRKEGLNVPLKAVVLYDGGYTMDNSTNLMYQQIAGFYQSAPGNARLTHIVGDGQPNFGEKVYFNGSQIALNPFSGALGPAGDPAWDSTTFTIPLAGSTTDPVTTSVDHQGMTSFDCLSWGAVVYSVPVLDTDGDGLLDIWETSTTLKDPTGKPLPNLKAMGANPNVKDIFIEIGYLKNTAPSWNALQGSEQNPMPAHDHLPSKKALDMMGDAFKNAPVNNPDKTTGIRVHFDVGNNYQTVPADPYIIPAAVARGGEWAPEVPACTTPIDPAKTATCQFPDFSGTVGWKSAYHFYRDQPFLADGTPLTEAQCVAAEKDPTKPQCVRRFDRNRKDMFHYAFFAHAVGLPRSLDTTSALNHIPANTSGIADLVGGDILVSLGFWHNYLPTDTYVQSANGTDYMQAATLMHELGHNLTLRHWGGVPQSFDASGTPVEYNCKPNYLSVMNYLFQARGLLTPSGVAVLDYERKGLPALDPNQVSEPLPFGGPLVLPYFTRWYAPKASSFIDRDIKDGGLGTTAATHHCNGSPITEGVGWVRVDGTSVNPPIDWNANGIADSTKYSQDVSFNGITVPPASKFPVLQQSLDDWSLIDLRQIGGRRNVGSKVSSIRFSLDVGYGDVGYGDVGYGDVGYGDVGYGDVGYGDVGYGDVGYGDVGYGDVGYGDVGYGDVGYGDVGAPMGDMDLETAESLGNAPDSLKAVNGKQVVNLSWLQPHVGGVNFYTVYRVLGTGITPANFPGRVVVATTNAPTTAATDTTAKNNTTYTYFVVATFFNGNQSGVSNLFTILVK